MNRIKKVIGFIAQDGKHKKILSAYVMPGFPTRDSTAEVLRSAEKAGVDFVEIGVPFSDPLADGPVIQKASQAAIENGMSPEKIVDFVRTFRKESELPLILMGYVNSFLNGIGRSFPEKLKSAGIDGVIIPDLSLEESDMVRKDIEDAGLSLVLLAAPTSTDERIVKISEASTDFVYCVSVTGVTGARKNLVSSDVTDFLKRVRKFSRKPFVVGFGISTPDTARDISKYSDGIVVGSALLQKISSSSQCGETAYEFLKSLRTAIDEE
ncbi:MAG TPA: tryptophan synthase subunit alpha [Candidatus Acidoferrales bacterium]|nr:tryptophan synthase subunit alpha [Candidatus Acidoferrales bacterium]